MTDTQSPLDLQVLTDLLADRAEADRALGSYVVEHREFILTALAAAVPEGKPGVRSGRLAYQTLRRAIGRSEHTLTDVASCFADYGWFMTCLRKSVDREKGRTSSKLLDGAMTDKQDPFDVEVLPDLLADRSDAYRDLGWYLLTHRSFILHAIRAAWPEPKNQWPVDPEVESGQNICAMLHRALVRPEFTLTDLATCFADHEEWFMPGIRKSVDREKGREEPKQSKPSMER